jgi:acyl-CoA reductase-like NAD-dependent aldehyde dehydrogenase
MKQLQMLINGRMTGSQDGRSFQSTCPADNQPHAELPHATIADAEAAVAAARRSFDRGVWSEMEGSMRAQVLWRLADLLEANQEELCRLEAEDQGKPVGYTRLLEFPMVVDCFRYFAGWADKLYGQTISVPADALDFTLREPVGVCLGLPANNYPLAMAAWKLAPALAAGNSMVLRPSPQTPVTAARIGELCCEAGIPDGVVNILTEPGTEIAIFLVAHPQVDLIALTGGTETGKRVARTAASGLKRTLLELGGKSPMLVLRDADLELAVTGAMNGAFFNCGQTCTAATRILVHQEIARQFTERLVERMKAVIIGHPLSDETQMGPMVSSAQLQRVRDYLDIGRAEGAQLLEGGEWPQDDGLDQRGNYITPALFVGVDNRMRIAQEEIFGPVSCLLTFCEEAEAVSQANESIYGLSASVWSRDIRRAMNIAKKLRAGTVWINNHNMFFNQAPFGGYKQSGGAKKTAPRCCCITPRPKMSTWSCRTPSSRRSDPRIGPAIVGGFNNQLTLRG